MIALLLTGNEHRGNDATGIAISQMDGGVSIFKKAIPAWQFINDKDYTTFVNKNLKKDTWGVILHTRFATQGTPKENKNNHPLFSGKSAIIHNGVINNDDALFKSMKYDRSAETDSDIIRAFIDDYGINEKCIKELNRISGSAAGAAFDPRYPNKMLLFRSGSPMTLGSTSDYFMFSSERGTVYKAMRPYVNRFKMWFQLERSDAAMSPMDDNTAYIIGPDGLESHREFKTLYGSYTEPIRRTYEGHNERSKKWNVIGSSSSSSSNAHVGTGPTLQSVTIPKIGLKDAKCPKCLKNWSIPKDGTYNDFSCNLGMQGCGTRLIDPARCSTGKGVN